MDITSAIFPKELLLKVPLLCSPGRPCLLFSSSSDKRRKGDDEGGGDGRRALTCGSLIDVLH